MSRNARSEIADGEKKEKFTNLKIESSRRPIIALPTVDLAATRKTLITLAPQFQISRNAHRARELFMRKENVAFP
jgi:hypothetical protein